MFRATTVLSGAFFAEWLFLEEGGLRPVHIDCIAAFALGGERRGSLFEGAAEDSLVEKREPRSGRLPSSKHRRNSNY